MASSRGMFAGRGVMFVKSVCFGMSTKVRLQGRESCIHSRGFEFGVSDYVGGLLTEIRIKMELEEEGNSSCAAVRMANWALLWSTCRAQWFR